MNKVMKIMAVVILAIMVTTVLVNASVLFIAFAGVSYASVIYGVGVFAMFSVAVYEFSKDTDGITIGSALSIAVLSLLSFVGIAWYLFETTPALIKARDIVVINFKDEA